MKKMITFLFLILSSFLLSLPVSAETIDYTPYYIKVLPFAVIFGVLVAVIACLLVRRSYSMKHKPVEYPFRDFTKLQLTEQYDRFIRRHVSERRINTNNK